MVASEFLSYINTFSAVNFVGIEDLADKANFQWNVIALLLCMILVTVRQYFMAPLVCYFPNTISGANVEQYVTNLCWVEGTYPWNISGGSIPHEDREWDQMKPIQMNYYQWVPLVLGLKAILFYIPRIIWSIYVYNRTGTDLESLVRLANTTSKEDGDNRDKNIHHIARSLELLLFSRRGLKEFDPDNDKFTNKVLSVMPAKRHGNNLIFYYIAVKVLYVIIGLFELFVMYRFLRFNAYEGYLWFGYRLLNDLVNGRQWTETQVFPRIGICRHSMQNVGSNNKIFAQCVLPINMLNEKIFIFLYFFISFVVIMTLISIPLWAFRMGPKRRQRHFIKRFLKMADAYRREDVKQIEIINSFIEKFLRSDGNFILRMLSMNAGDMITVEIVCCLFNRFSKDYIHRDFRGRPTINRPPKGKNSQAPVPLDDGRIASKKQDESLDGYCDDNLEHPTSVHSNDAMSRKYPPKMAYQSANV